MNLKKKSRIKAERRKKKQADEPVDFGQGDDWAKEIEEAQGVDREVERREEENNKVVEGDIDKEVEVEELLQETCGPVEENEKDGKEEEEVMVEDIGEDLKEDSKKKDHELEWTHVKSGRGGRGGGGGGGGRSRREEEEMRKEKERSFAIPLQQLVNDKEEKDEDEDDDEEEEEEIKTVEEVKIIKKKVEKLMGKLAEGEEKREEGEEMKREEGEVARALVE